ncbi:flagellar filament capping protein FliD [Achromobacter sp. GG226]|uniref:flagellar filament capping protein FliD n=1 Tax=Verticiella alkaliphila TaxID=2779529 RepID=UPI001C0BFC5C|nr:flagellar filament capping protein FliD [Verticiella sp. GG226]MBU4610477.1 flagellar filament capping protein FliD [Verticiella sp. GG226]
MASIGGTLGLSGLPLAETLAKLRTVEEAPLTALARRADVMEAKVSAYGVISSALSTFKATIANVGKESTFGTFKATSSQTDVLTATAPANGGAVGGQYTIHVQELATNQSLSVAGQASRDASIGSGGTIEFTLGDGTTHTVDLLDHGTSLEGIRAAINADSKLGVSATLINSGDPDAPFVLSLSTKDTGLDARVTNITVHGNAELADVLGYDEATSATNPTNVTQPEGAEAKDARITVNGIAITSGKNTLEGAIEGVNITLSAKTQDKPVTLRIARDDTPAVSAVEAFVNGYNALKTVLTNLTNYNAETDQASALTGDRVPRSVDNQLRNVLGNAIDNGGLATMAQLGVKTNVITGKLELDKDKLTKVLADDPEGVMKLFTGERGLVAKLNTTVDQLLSKDGLITTAQDGLKQSVKDIEKQAVRVQARVEDTMSRYEAQFVQLEKFISQMNGTSSYLAQQLDMLAATAKNSK